MTKPQDDGEAVAWLRQILDGTSVKISSGDWRVENDHWHGITMSASFARALTRQLAEARAERDSARRGVAARLIYHRQSQKGQCCDDCYCVALANAISEYAEPSPTPPAPVVTEEMAIITGCNAWFEARLRRGLDTELRKCGYPSCTCTQTPTAIKAALSRQLADAQAERDRIIEDRARFPDRPDDIGRMIQAHIGNLKAGKEAADEHARNAFAKLQVVRADLAEAQGVIERQKQIIAWIECWVSHPVGSYSVYALDGLFGMTRDKIASLSTPPRPQANGEPR